MQLSSRLQGSSCCQLKPRRPRPHARKLAAGAVDPRIADAADTALPAPTRVRVQHDTVIRASRASLWSLMQELTPASQWPQVSVVLATLEAIYGVEYQGLAEQLLTAFQEANRLQAQADPADPAVSSSSSSSSNGVGPAAADEEAQRLEHLGMPRQRNSKPPLATAVHSLGSSSSSSSNGSSSSQQALADDAAAGAAAADAAFMQLLLLLASKSGFVPLSERDVALGISLNTDYLWQLFVKVNTKQLDRGLVAPYVGSSSAGDSSSSSRDITTMSGLDSLLVLRRGYGCEKQRGRWLLQKLDALQLLLVKRAVKGVVVLSQRLMQQLAAAADSLAHGPAAAREQAKQRRRQKQQQQQQAAPRASSAAASEVQQQRHGASLKQQSKAAVKLRPSRQPQQRAAKQAAVKRPQPTQQQQLQQQPGALDLGDQLAGIAAALAAMASSPQLASSSSSSSSDDNNGGESTRGTPDVESSSSSSSSSSSAGSEAATAEAFPAASAARGTGTRAESSSRTSSAASPVRRLRLRQRAEQSLQALAYSLSDWGLIPRLDVTPLEQFDATFPLHEPSRLTPLFIEKATLPDILDPVIEPRLRWLLGRQQQQQPRAAAGSSDGSLWAGDDAAAAAAATAFSGGISDGSTSSSSSAAAAAAAVSPGFLDTFWRPVELLEPTFQQLLVVHRKLPRRPDRWREFRGRLGQLRDRILGPRDPQKQQQQQQQQQIAPPAAGRLRPAPIQLQVYRDIPLPSWSVVYPDKLLQFRPLDLLRLDLFGLAGAGAALAQLRFDNPLLELVALVTLTAWGTRLVLGYLRMGDRYKSIIAQLLAERTVAGGEGGLEFVATAAGLQQFKQAALAYVLLLQAGQALGEEQLAAAAERVLQQKLQLQVRFEASEALGELQRFGLLLPGPGSGGDSKTAAIYQQQQQQQQNGRELLVVAAPTAASAADTAPARHGASLLAVEQQQQQQLPGVVVDGLASTPKQPSVLYAVIDGASAQQVLQAFWQSLLQQRVDSILRDVPQ